MQQPLPVPSYHLRRVNPKSHYPEELILLGEVTKFGRNADNVDVVLTSAVYSNMISRDHAIITGHRDERGIIIGYKIRDNSLNGTYINDRRVKDEVTLMDSAVIKFGHMNGAAIKAGVEAPQANAEFSFVFEKCSLNRKYMGWEGVERRRTVVCTGDGKPIMETGGDHREKRKAQMKMEPVSSTTHMPPSASSSVANPYQLQQQQPAYPPHPAAAAAPMLTNPHFMMMLQQQQQQQMGLPQLPFAHPQIMQQQLAGFPLRPPSYGANPLMMGGGQGGGVNTAVRLEDPRPPSSLPSTSSSLPPPIRSPPVECDSSVPSPPKGGDGARNAPADSSIGSPKRKDEMEQDDDAFSVPDSPPRAPRPIDLPGRSVTNSPAPPSPKPVEKEPPPKEEVKEKKKTPVTPKKPLVNGGKVPKSGGGVKKKGNKEVDRLLTDLTDGSFMMQARKKAEGGGSERRNMIDQGRKSAKKAVPKNKLHRQLSSASSDSESDDDDSRTPVRAPRQSVDGKKGSVKGKEKKKEKKKKKGKKMKRVGMGRREDSDESDPYEETDEESEDEGVKGKKGGGGGGEKRVSMGGGRVGMGGGERKKVASPSKPKKSAGGAGKKKKKGSSSSSSSSDGDEEAEEAEVEAPFEDTPNTTCAAVNCRKPPGENVQWVCCDGCDGWLHVFCHFGKEEKYNGKTFFCHPCAAKQNKKRKKE